MSRHGGKITAIGLLRFANATKSKRNRSSTLSVENAIDARSRRSTTGEAVVELAHLAQRLIEFLDPVVEAWKMRPASPQTRAIGNLVAEIAVLTQQISGNRESTRKASADF